MAQDEQLSRCYCLIPHPARTALLVRKTGDQYECPSLLLPPQRLNFFPDHIPCIRQELRRDTGIEMTVLRHLRDDGDIQICLMEVQSAEASIAADYVWLDAAGGDPSWTDERSAQAWRAWRLAFQSGGDEAITAPWERSGWFTEAALWMQTRLREAGYGWIGAVDQLKGAWGWSSLLKAETDRGVVYFKADYDHPPQEAAVIFKLAKRWPQNVPHIIAADMERRWMLLSDFGGDDLDAQETDAYHSAISLFAKIQQSTAPDIQEWKLLGCPEMTPAYLFRMAEQILADTDICCGGAEGLSHEELTRLRGKLSRIEEMLARLSASALPPVISNEDFKAGNVAVCGGQPLFYDWSSTVISHPLFGINYFLNRMPRSESVDGFRWRNGLEDERRRELMSLFLSEWTDYASWDACVSEFWLCRRLYYLYEAVKCYCDLPFIGATSPWGAGSQAYISSALRKLMAVLAQS